jgi:hypothetical protein
MLFGEVKAVYYENCVKPLNTRTISSQNSILTYRNNCFSNDSPNHNYSRLMDDVGPTYVSNRQAAPKLVMASVLNYILDKIYALHLSLSDPHNAISY